MTRSTLGIPKDELKELRKAAKKVGTAMGGRSALKTLDLMETRMNQLHVMNVLLRFMEDNPEYRNQYLVDDMKLYLDSMIVDIER